MRTSAKTSVPPSSAMRSISPSRQRQLRSTSRSPAARNSSAQRSSARAPSRFMAGLTNRSSARLTGTLYVVATPIGNLADAQRALARGAAPASSSSPAKTRAPLARCSRTTASRRARSPLHEHNERAAIGQADQVDCAKVKSVALVSDAGTPGAVRSGRAGSWPRRTAPASAVSPIPGPSAAAAAFSAAGFPSARFLFAGFLPAQGAARAQGARIARSGVAGGAVRSAASHRGNAAGPRRAFRCRARDRRRPRADARSSRRLARLPLGSARDWLAERRERAARRIRPRPRAGSRAHARRASTPTACSRCCSESLPPSEAAKLAARSPDCPRASCIARPSSAQVEFRRWTASRCASRTTGTCTCATARR